MKRLISIILSGALLTTVCIGASITANAAVVCEVSDNGYLFDTFEDGTAKLIGYEGSETELVIPKDINGCTVTGINYVAFANNTNITSVKIPDTVTLIDINAFKGCTSLAEITIPDSVENIKCGFDDTAYYHNVDNWEDGALYIDNHLIDTTQQVTGEYKIKDGTITISPSVFENCTALTDITIPESVKRIDCSFEDTELYNNTDNWEDGALYINNHLVATNEEIAMEYALKDGTVSISSTALSSGYIRQITIPASVQIINDKTLLSFSPFLKEINVVEENEYYHSIDGVLVESKTNTLLKYPASKIVSDYTIPEGIKNIYEPAFYSCEFTTLTFPSSVEKLIRPEQSVHNTHYTLHTTKINVSEDNEYLYSVDGVLFDKQSNALIKYPAKKTDTEYTIPDGVTEIEDYAFYASKLKQVTIPESVTVIKECAFNLSHNLKSATILNPRCSIFVSAFDFGNRFKVRGYENSSAQRMAVAEDFKFVSLGEADGTANKDQSALSTVANLLDGPVVTIILVVALISLIVLLFIKRKQNKKSTNQPIISHKPMSDEITPDQITQDQIANQITLDFDSNSD
ncbi:MAG: leucine-rich repeat domain-containing protein [Acutalibacteraceae bacterium]|nr:leucine-rich repeat domain-containing protein [Acutalibacteraceae bacterium]